MKIFKYGREIGSGQSSNVAIFSACENDAVLAEEIKNLVEKLGYAFVSDNEPSVEKEPKMNNPISSYESF